MITGVVLILTSSLTSKMKSVGYLQFEGKEGRDCLGGSFGSKRLKQSSPRCGFDLDLLDYSCGYLPEQFEEKEGRECLKNSWPSQIGRLFGS